MIKFKFESQNIYIVMYHYVREKLKHDPVKHYLELSKFKDQISFFKKKADILSYDDFEEILEKKNIKKKPSIILTFDDGYIDHYKYVFPLLIKNKVSGIFYPPAGIIEKKIILDVNKIHLILAKEEPIKILNLILFYLKKIFDLDYCDLRINKLNLTSRYDSKETQIIKILLQYYLPNHIRKKIINIIFKKIFKSNESYLCEKIYMSEKNIREMSKNSMVFGSHGYDHLWWGNLKLNEQEKELCKSINFFKKNKIFNKSLSVAYPYGSYNKDTIKLLKKYNIKFALTTKIGSVNTKNIRHSLTLPRYDTNDFN